MDPTLVARYSELDLSICALENKHVEAQYKTQLTQLTSVRSQRDKLKKNYEIVHAELQKQTKKDEILHKKGFHFSKFKARVTGGLKEKIDKKEGQIEELTHKDEEYKHDLDILEDQCLSTQRIARDLEHDVITLHAYREEQDTILHTVFDGPIGDVDENNLEKQCEAAKAQKDQIAQVKARYENCRHFLAGGIQQLKQAVQLLEQAGFNNRAVGLVNVMDGPGGNNTPMMDIIKQQRINKAKMHLAEGKQSLSNAKGIVPELPRIEDSQINTIGLLGDMVFDGIASDMIQGRKIRKSIESVHETLQSAGYALAWLDQVLNTRINTDLSAAETNFFNLKNTLKTKRVDLIHKIAENMATTASNDAPPPQQPHVEEYQQVATPKFETPVSWSAPEETHAKSASNHVPTSENLYGFDPLTGI